MYFQSLNFCLNSWSWGQSVFTTRCLVACKHLWKWIIQFLLTFVKFGFFLTLTIYLFFYSFWDIVSHWTWRLAVWLDWESPCLHISHTGIIGAGFLHMCRWEISRSACLLRSTLYTEPSPRSLTFALSKSLPLIQNSSSKEILVSYKQQLQCILKIITLKNVGLLQNKIIYIGLFK